MIMITIKLDLTITTITINIIIMKTMANMVKISRRIKTPINKKTNKKKITTITTISIITKKKTILTVKIT